MTRIGTGIVAGIATAACLCLLYAPAAQARHHHHLYRSHVAYPYGGTSDPAFGYAPRGYGTPHPYGPEPGGGFQHEGQYGIGHTD